MPDPTESLNRTADLVARIRTRADELDDAEFKVLAADLQLALTDLKSAVIAATSTEEPDYRGDMYYFGEQGPFCVNCWDTRQKRVHLAPLERSLIGMGRFVCPQCNSFYKGERPQAG